MTQPVATLSSHLDFQGLGALRGQAQRKEGDALREAARQFEAMFVQQIMKSMRDSGIEGGALVQSQAMETFQDMHDREISMQMAKRGSFGLADMLVRQMERPQAAQPAAQVLQGRAATSSASDGVAVPAVVGAGMRIEPPPTSRSLRTDPPAMALPRRTADGLPLRPELSMPGGRRAYPSDGADRK